MSSHREAPEISKDPVADSTDLYAFVSPDKPDTVTIVANYIPLESPSGGPNFYEFGDDVRYEILIDNDGDGVEEITYRFEFQTTETNPNTFLYNTGPITSLTDKSWNRRQTYTVTRIDGMRDSGNATVLATGVPCPPVSIGPRSTPNYDQLAAAAIMTLPSGETVFAGQRADAFYVDLGSIFDLGALRPVQNLHLLPMPAAMGVNGVMGHNVHSIVIQVPKTMLTMDGSNPTDPMSGVSVIGVWTAASRQMAMVRDRSRSSASYHQAGPWQQVSRLGNPLINEVIIPMGMKDDWNADVPSGDSQYVQFYQKPELAGLLPVLYPGVFPNLAAYSKPRNDLVAILLTGIPSGVVPGFQNSGGTVQADLLRLNMAIPPAAIGKENPAGLVGGDAAGFPNGRRIGDNIVAVEINAVAGAALPLVDPSFMPDAPVAKLGLTDGTTPDVTPLAQFPYMPSPHDGFSAS
jgi:hypothetical protein